MVAEPLTAAVPRVSDRDAGRAAEDEPAVVFTVVSERSTTNPDPPPHRPRTEPAADPVCGPSADPSDVAATAAAGGRGRRMTASVRVGRLVRRWMPGSGRRRALAVVVSALLSTGAALAAIATWLTSGPVAEPAPALPVVSVGQPVSATAAPDAAGDRASRGDESSRADRSGESEQLVVSVIGKVTRPGLVTLPAGARVADAVQAAGGALADADLNGLNLARRLGDGEQIAVGVPLPATADGVPGGGVADGSTAGGNGLGGDTAGASGEPAAQPKVNLNTASQAQLDAIPGVGPVTAQRIIAWRVRHGRFHSVDQLREVDGIGDGRLARLKEFVTT
ncbi:competence protein ComEA [Goodfellowiella coeruleoviolacea]|uniref:Competence protein ComEA n=2 Tax=Goodfellowiella coeruleoviolacea TaxID=334858 RepID=A0AAE3GBA1_9PSEU|nr:competence protein ComEA [Goodfellowiella coeruleoviolacea]